MYVQSCISHLYTNKHVDIQVLTTCISVGYNLISIQFNRLETHTLSQIVLSTSTVKRLILAGHNFGSLIYYIILAPLILVFLLAELINTLK